MTFNYFTLFTLNCKLTELIRTYFPPWEFFTPWIFFKPQNTQGFCIKFKKKLNYKPFK